tara:strand:- start:1630 stop:1755 length:126 start_codon:yes stop_codon:yes gene_type:complete
MRFGNIMVYILVGSGKLKLHDGEDWLHQKDHSDLKIRLSKL